MLTMINNFTIRHNVKLITILINFFVYITIKNIYKTQKIISYFLNQNVMYNNTFILFYFQIKWAYVFILFNILQFYNYSYLRY